MSNTDDALVDLSRQRIERGSKSFAAAARLLPLKMRESAYMLYAWCRYCDDEIDGQELGFSSAQLRPLPGQDRPAVEVVETLRRRTIAACRGQPDDSTFEALARVVQRHDIPHRLPLDLIEGFAMDARAEKTETLEDTLRYSYHVAGVVGLMMARVMGVTDRATLLRACDLGIAFQLTNIARDVIEDAGIGRIYLPHDWLQEAGVDVANVAASEKREAISHVAIRLLDEAERYYQSATYGIAALPIRAGIAIAGARGVYRAIGTDVRQLKANAWDSRIIVSKRRKLAILAAAPVQVTTYRTRALLGTPPRRRLWTPTLTD